MHPMPPLPPRRWIAHTLAGWILGVPLLLGLSILFEAVGIEREVGRKFGRFHDVIVMERLL